MSDAKYYLDLLQVVACLKENSTHSIYEPQIYKYGHCPKRDGERIIIGLSNAAGFLSKVYDTGKLIDISAIPHYRINPLVQKLNIKLEEFENKDIPKISFSAINEGTKIKNNKPYFGFETSYFFMAKVCLSMDRIVEFQSNIINQCVTFHKSTDKYDLMGAGKPCIINEDSHRSYTSTLSSYDSRAKNIGGVQRFLDDDLIFRSKKYESKLINPEWQIKSNDIVDEINSIENNTLLKESFGDLARTLIEDGIYYLKEKQFLDYTMLSHSLDGGAKNFIVLDSKIDPVLIPNKNLIKEDFIIDSKYQNIFGTSNIIGSGIYGIKGKSNTTLMSTDGSIRANRNSIPKIKCDNLSSLLQIIDKIRIENIDKQIFYRGQNNHWNLDRSPNTNQLLYGKKFIEELSLPTAASREKFDFDGFNAILQFQIQGILYERCNNSQFDKLDDNWPYWTNFSPFEDAELEDIHEKFKRLYYSYEWDLMTMGLAQHYGIPTHGLDITSDIDIALWFSLNKYFKYNEAGKEYAWYKPLVRSHYDDLTKFPVIYIIGIKSNLKNDLDQIGYIDIKAERPKRQKAFLHYGGYGLHSNICAEDVIAAVFITDEFKYKQKYKTEYLFPSTTEDDFYKSLLSLKENALMSGLNYGYDKIVEYKPFN